MTNTTTQLIQAFAFDSHAVRVVTIDGQPWFVAKDVCECLEISNHWNCIAKLDDDEKGLQTLESLGGQQEMSVMNESGLYATILRSQGAMTPGTPAHTFRKWVTSEVLPAIRLTGRYAAPGVTQPFEGQLSQLLSGVEKLLAILPPMMEVMTQMASAMPRMLEATQPARGKQGRKRLYTEDAERILALRDKGYKLDDLVVETEFSQSQCWSIISGRYKVLESGRVSIDLRSDSARAADQAARDERNPKPDAQ